MLSPIPLRYLHTFTQYPISQSQRLSFSHSRFPSGGPGLWLVRCSINVSLTLILSSLFLGTCEESWQLKPGECDPQNLRRKWVQLGELPCREGLGLFTVHAEGCEFFTSKQNGKKGNIGLHMSDLFCIRNAFTWPILLNRKPQVHLVKLNLNISILYFHTD